LRQLWKEVNLAAVNYHFGSKKNLIQAVLKRYFDIAIPLIDNNIETWLLRDNKTARSLVESLANPLILIESQKPNSTVLFVQLLGRGYSESQGHLRRFITENYGMTIDKMLSAFQVLIPNINREELFWRLHFALGSCVFSLSSNQALAEISEADFARHSNVESIITRLIQFIAAGIECK
jgi:AcrR family transcriptional regulator